MLGELASPKLNTRKSGGAKMAGLLRQSPALIIPIHNPENKVRVLSDRLIAFVSVSGSNDYERATTTPCHNFLVFYWHLAHMWSTPTKQGRPPASKEGPARFPAQTRRTAGRRGRRTKVTSCPAIMIVPGQSYFAAASQCQA